MANPVLEHIIDGDMHVYTLTDPETGISVNGLLAEWQHHELIVRGMDPNKYMTSAMQGDLSNRKHLRKTRGKDWK